jgi:hypothetical protein
VLPAAATAQRKGTKMNKNTDWSAEDIVALAAFDEEQRIRDQREEAHRSRFMKTGDLESKRSSFGEDGDKDDDKGGISLADTLSYGKCLRDQADESEYAMNRQKVIDAIIDAVDEFIKNSTEENQDIFHSVYGEMKQQMDVAADMNRLPPSINRTLKRIQGNLRIYLIKNYPDLLQEYLSGLR